ncbi:MAG: hypothetical protein K2N90_09815 [Lachnospiraceae bacterium]|nr:hypothetical protein [Lachnospiraceae bacterium]
MEFLGNGKSSELSANVSNSLYRALATGDIPAAWLLTKPLLERSKMEKLSASTAFNCGLCLYQLNEYEKALASLRQAEQSLGTPPDLDTQEKKLFLQAVMAAQQVFLKPLDPENMKGLERYFLIRIRWLSALCLLHLERQQEAAPIIRFLAQYHIEL